MSGFFSSVRRIVCLVVLSAVSANAVATVVLDPEEIALGTQPPSRPFGTAEEFVYLFQTVSATGLTTGGPTPEWSVSSLPTYGEVGFILSGIESDTTATVSRTATSDTVIIRYRLSEDPFPVRADQFTIVVTQGQMSATLIRTVGIKKNPAPQILDLERTVLAPTDPPTQETPSRILEIAGGDTSARVTFYAGKERESKDVGITPYFSWLVSAVDGGASVAFANGQQTTTGRGFAMGASNTLQIIIYPSGVPEPIEIVYREDGDSISFDDGPDFVVVVKDTLGLATTLNVSIEQMAPVIVYQGSPVGRNLSFVSYEQDPNVSFELSADYLCPPPPSNAQCLIWDVLGSSQAEIGEFSESGDPVTVAFTGDGISGASFEIEVTADAAGAPGGDKSATVAVTITAQLNRPPVITGIAGDTTRINLHEIEKSTMLTFTATDMDLIDLIEAGRMTTGTLMWSLGTDSLTASTAVFVDADGQAVEAPTGTTVRVRFRQNAETFINGTQEERTFTLRVSDGVATTRAMVEMLVLKNQRPKILSIDGRESSSTFYVASNLLDARFPAVAEDDFDTGPSLTWSVSTFLTGENAESTLNFVVDEQFVNQATGNNVMLALRRADGDTTVTFVLAVTDSLAAEGSSSEVKVTVDDSTPMIVPEALSTITAGRSGTYTFRAKDPGLGQKARLEWEVVSTSLNNLVVMPSTATGAEVEFTATFERAQLEGSFVLRVENSVGNISTRRVTVERRNEPPVVSYQDQDQSLTFRGTGDTAPVSIILPFGTTGTTPIELSADDPVGEPVGGISAFSWTIYSQPSDSTATFVTSASGSSVMAQFEVPEDLSGEDRSFTIRVSDGRDENGVTDVPVVVSRTTEQLFRIRMFLGGAAR